MRSLNRIGFGGLMQNQICSEEEVTLVDLKKMGEVNFWCEELNLRADELKEIVKSVGPKINDIRMHITKKMLNSMSVTY